MGYEGGVYMKIDRMTENNGNLTSEEIDYYELDLYIQLFCITLIFYVFAYNKIKMC